MGCLTSARIPYQIRIKTCSYSILLDWKLDIRVKQAIAIKLLTSDIHFIYVA